MDVSFYGVDRMGVFESSLRLQSEILKNKAYVDFNAFCLVITVHQAIPFLIGSEIGASLTNGRFLGNGNC